MRRMMSGLVVLVTVIFSFLGITSIPALSSHSSQGSSQFYEAKKGNPLYLQLGNPATPQDQQTNQYADHYSHSSHVSHSSHYSHYSHYSSR